MNIRSVKYALVLLLPVMVACGSGESTGKRIKVVQTVQVRGYGQSEQVALPASTKAAAQGTLSFRVAGKIARSLVSDGELVRTGQTLAVLDDRDYRAQFAATEAEYLQVKAEAERVMQLYEKQSVSPNDYDKAVSGLKQMTEKYEAHRNALADTKLTAPYDGYIMMRHFRENEVVDAGTPVFTIVGGVPEIETYIPASMYLRLGDVEAWSCSHSSLGDKEMPLELIAVGKQANANQLYQVRLRVVGKESPSLPYSMPLTVNVTYKSEESSDMVVPASALFGKGEDTKVWVYGSAEGCVNNRKVSVVQWLKDGHVVIRGLDEGEQVVTGGVHSLSEGEQVRVMEKKSPSNMGGLL